ncbi:MAG: hypothetical protein AAGM22_30795 [Acidobacteriota bacterium]
MFEWLKGDAKKPADAGDVVVADSEYAVIELTPSWGLLSIALGLFSLPFYRAARYLPWHPTHHWFRPGEMVLAMAAVATAGIFFGWLGVRSKRSQTLSKIGLFLNVTIVGVLALFVSVLLIYFRLR